MPRIGRTLHQNSLVLLAGDSCEWEMAVNLNLTAPMLLTQAFAAGMVENKVWPLCYVI